MVAMTTGLAGSTAAMDPATMRRLLNQFRGGQAGDPYGFARGQVVDTTGQYDFGGLANAIGMAMPGGGFTNTFGRVAQSAFGPHGVVGMEEVGIGHPQWGDKIAAIREAQRRNRAQRDRNNRDRRDRATGEGAAGGNENAPAGRSADGL